MIFGWGCEGVATSVMLGCGGVVVRARLWQVSLSRGVSGRTKTLVPPVSEARRGGISMVWLWRGDGAEDSEEAGVLDYRLW